MADDLRRVGLVFKEDGAVDFKKSLQEVNLELNKNYNEFKLAQSQWDESTTKIQKLREQQEYLNNALDFQQDKVNTLKMELSDLENAENKNTTAIKKKRTELLNAEVQLKNYNNRLEKTKTDLDNAEKGIKTTAEKIAELNEKVKENENAFKLTQTQYTALTSKSQKLKDEQQYLTNVYNIQKEKIELLNEQLQELESSEDKDTIAISKKRQELQKAQTELNNYNNKLKIVTNQLQSFGAKAIEVGGKIENVGNKIEGAGKNLSAFSAATAGALVASAKSAIDFEDAFTGVTKTVDGTEEQLEEIKQGIIEMSKELPSTTTEISAVAEAAGQLGIKTENILGFSKAMIDLGNSTNLTADEAATQLARFANIMQMSQSDFDRLGSAIVDLGNNFQTSEAEIVSMSMRLAGAGKQVGLSEGQVLGLATALSSVGIEAEMGGSAISKMMVNMQNAVEMGGTKLNTVLKKTGKSLRSLELMSANKSKDFKALAGSIGMTSTELNQLIKAGANLEDFAKISGMSAKDFQKAWKEDAAGALTAFIKGLGDAENKGESAITMLSEMGLTEVRLRDSLLRAANAGNLFNNAISTGTKAWEENTALTNEANKRYGTLKSQIGIATNKIKALAISFGNKLMPEIKKGIEYIDKLAKRVEKLDDKQVKWILNVAKAVVTIGPLVTILGKVTSVTGKTIKTIGTFTQAIGVIRGTVTTTSTAVNGLAGVIGALTSPLGAALVATTALAAGLTYLTLKESENQKQTKELAQAMADERKSFEEVNNAIDEQMNANLAQISNSQKLRDELSTLVDENGKVKEGYEARVSFILKELNKALGTEYSLNGNIVNSYKEIQEQIDKTIEKKKAQIILQADEEKWTQALKNQEEAVERVKKVQEELGMTYEQAKKRYEELKDSKEAEENWSLGKEKLDLENLIKAYDDAEYILKEWTDAEKKYHQDYELFIQEKYDEIGKTIKDTTKDWTDSTIEEIKNGINEQEKNLKNYKEIYERTGNEVALENKKQAENNLEALIKELQERTSTIGTLGEDEINAWKQLADSSYSKYYDTISKMPSELSNTIQEMTGVTASRTPELVGETEKMMQQVIDEVDNEEEFRKKAVENLTGLLNGFNDEGLKELLMQAGVNDVDKVMDGIRNGNLAEDEGINILKSLKSGLNNNSWKENLWNSARSIASKLSGLLSVKASVNENSASIPGHKLGLDYVPKDNYIARLHKGERVLTKEENEEYTNAEEINNKNKAIINQIDYKKMSQSIGNAIAYENNKIIELLTKILEKEGQSIVLDTGQFVGATTNSYNIALANSKTREERGN